MMRCGHLFNGIGGFALAAHWMGWKNIFHCEIDEFCNKVMNKHFPESIQHGNIKEQDFTGYRGTIDLLTGGWPCQPVSTAGKRKGKEDVRYLWPENIRAIREIQPRWVVGENVRGLTNWEGGVLFDEVQADLETEGYEVLPFLLPAAGVNAPHRRDRIWFIAYRANAGVESLRPKRENSISQSCVIANSNDAWGYQYHQVGYTKEEGESVEEKRQRLWANLERAGITRSFADTTGVGGIQSVGQSEAGQFDQTDWQQFPTQSPVRNGNDGIPDRLAGITVPRWRREGIKAMGNAIVPQVALQLFKAIQEYETHLPPHP